jgi:hypothetical protein
LIANLDALPIEEQAEAPLSDDRPTVAKTLPDDCESDEEATFLSRMRYATRNMKLR